MSMGVRALANVLCVAVVLLSDTMWGEGLRARDRGRPGSLESRGPGRKFQRILHRADANNDGKISREEFPGSKQIFEKMDQDSDGIITAQEFNARQRRSQGPRSERGNGRRRRSMKTSGENIETIRGRRGRFQDFSVDKPSPGDLAPKFELRDLSGRSVSLADLLATKSVVVEFGSFT